MSNKRGGIIDGAGLDSKERDHTGLSPQRGNHLDVLRRRCHVMAAVARVALRLARIVARHRTVARATWSDLAFSKALRICQHHADKEQDQYFAQAFNHFLSAYHELLSLQ